MDLALELGAGSVHALVTSMPADELADWIAYATKRGLPTRRMEMYLAQIAQVTAGGKLEDYLLKSREPEADADDVDAGAQTFSALSGGNVYVLNVERHPLQEQLDRFERDHAMGLH